jgi:hypothetical protein
MSCHALHHTDMKEVSNYKNVSALLSALFHYKINSYSVADPKQSVIMKYFVIIALNRAVS